MCINSSEIQKMRNNLQCGLWLFQLSQRKTGYLGPNLHIYEHLPPIKCLSAFHDLLSLLSAYISNDTKLLNMFLQFYDMQMTKLADFQPGNSRLDVFQEWKAVDLSGLTHFHSLCYCTMSDFLIDWRVLGQSPPPWRYKLTMGLYPSARGERLMFN